MKPRPIFFTSDHHFGHENIIQYCDRPFRDAYHMDEVMALKWNQAVPPDAKVFYLGDFMFYNKRDASLALQGLNFSKMIWIVGNHDRSPQWCEDLDPRIVALRGPIWLPLEGQYVRLSHEPAEIPLSGGYIALHGHVHNESDIRRVPWGGAFFNVGVDKNNFRPWRWTEIKARLRRAGL